MNIKIKLTTFLKKAKEKCSSVWKQFDLDYKIIGFALIVWFILLALTLALSNKTDGYHSTATIMIQLTGISLASVAAIIAFRNYRRKSGDEFSYLYEGTSTYISTLMLHNRKDKLVSIFAIDVILFNKQRIRLADFSNPIEPLNLSAFESKKITLKKVHLYGNEFSNNFDFKEMSKLICITSNGPKKAEKLNLFSLSNSYMEQNNILRAYRIRNKPEKYEDSREVDFRARYWISIIEYRNTNDYEGNMYVLTGYINEDKFLITDESFKYIKEYINGLKLENYLRDKIDGKSIDIVDHVIKDHSMDPNYVANCIVNGEEPPTHYQDIDYPLFQLYSVHKIEYDNGP